MILQLFKCILTFRWLSVWQRNFLFWKKTSLSSILGNLADPLIYLFALGLGMGKMIKEINGISYTSFLASGIVTSGIMLSASFECTYALFTRMKGQRTWESLLHTPLQLIDVLLGEVAWASSKAIASGMAIVTISCFFGYTCWRGILTIIPIFFLTSFCFAGLASVMSSLAKNYDFFLFYQTLFLTPTTLLSGIFFPINQLPTGLLYLIKSLPLYHAIELVRAPLLGKAITSIYTHISVLTFYAITSFLISHYFFKKRLLE